MILFHFARKYPIREKILKEAIKLIRFRPPISLRRKIRPAGPSAVHVRITIRFFRHTFFLPFFSFFFFFYSILGPIFHSCDKIREKVSSFEETGLSLEGHTRLNNVSSTWPR